MDMLSFEKHNLTDPQAENDEWKVPVKYVACLDRRK